MSHFWQGYPLYSHISIKKRCPPEPELAAFVPVGQQKKSHKKKKAQTLIPATLVHSLHVLAYSAPGGLSPGPAGRQDSTKRYSSVSHPFCRLQSRITSRTPLCRPYEIFLASPPPCRPPEAGTPKIGQNHLTCRLPPPLFLNVLARSSPRLWQFQQGFESFLFFFFLGRKIKG